ncbi:hypothetical protein QJS10_CPB15g01659 [Acorus calamus]|uniref:Uncharacterized protein n=1 Tax=Acorus calamus TaxID=4465 RepID=A0AAV9D4D9_ACOCL|nr:hypothetical protein QJS10_CPB15g01659 [Acorus calamus]
MARLHEKGILPWTSVSLLSERKSSPVRRTEVSVVKVALEVEVRKFLIFVVGRERGSSCSFVAVMTVKMRTPRTKRAKQRLPMAVMASAPRFFARSQTMRGMFFQAIGVPLVKDALEGYNASILTYGQNQILHQRAFVH